jgi:hypothetical protein
MICLATLNTFFTREGYTSSKPGFVCLLEWFLNCTPEPQLIVPENLIISHGVEKMEIQAEHTKITQFRKKRKNKDGF